MFLYDHPDYTESTWRHEADTLELAMLDADRRDMQEYKVCCENPLSFTIHQSLDLDTDTGYSEGPCYSCNECGSVIGEEDYAAIVAWSERRPILVRSEPRQPAAELPPVPRKEAA